MPCALRAAVILHQTRQSRPTAGRQDLASGDLISAIQIWLAAATAPGECSCGPTRDADEPRVLHRQAEETDGTLVTPVIQRKMAGGLGLSDQRGTFGRRALGFPDQPGDLGRVVRRQRLQPAFQQPMRQDGQRRPAQGERGVGLPEREGPYGDLEQERP